MNAELNSLSC